MSNSESNKALASALRSRGVTDVRPVWAAAKAAMASGATPEQAAASFGAASTTPAKVSQPAVQYATRTSKRKPAKPAAKQRPTRPALTGHPQHVVPVVLARTEGELAMELSGAVQVWPARPSMKNPGKMTHDVVVHANGVAQPRSTLSAAALERLLSGTGTRVAVSEKIYLATATRIQ